MTELPNKDLPVLIIGGGIGGLAAALAIARAGYAVTVVEQAPRFEEIGAGIQIAPNAYAALDALGVGDQTRARSVFCDQFVMMDGIDGTEILSIPMGQEFQQRYSNRYGVIHRADIHQSLLEGVTEHDRVELIPGVQIVGIEQDEDGVTAFDAAGRKFRGSILVGADGGRSVIRQQLVNDEAHPTGHIVYRAVVDAAEFPDALKRNAPVVWTGADCHMVNYPLQGARSYNIVATFKARAPEAPGSGRGTSQEVLEMFAGMDEAVMQVLRIPKEWGRWVTADKQPIDRWVFDRTTLLGDAAHPTAQYLAQGACMSLEDAVTLGRALDIHRGDFAAALGAYEKARVLRTARLVLTAREMGRMSHLTGMERAVRNAMWRGMPASTSYPLLDWMWGWKAENCLKP